MEMAKYLDAVVLPNLLLLVATTTCFQHSLIFHNMLRTKQVIPNTLLILYCHDKFYF